MFRLLRPSAATLVVGIAVLDGGLVRADEPVQAPNVRAATWLPDAVASFGAARLDDHLYVYGGHIGRQHQHSKDNLSKVFARCSLTAAADGPAATAWEMLPMDTPAQGVQIVAARDRVYRIGGLVAHNAKGEEALLESLSSVCEFDPTEKTWTAVTPLPEPRSSHDAIALDDAIYVVGGWTLTPDGGTFLDTAWRLDPDSDEPTWVAMPAPPFKRRALVLAVAFGKLFAIGGLTPEGETSSRVDVFDPKTGAWSRGPDLPGNGFGAGAIGHGDALYATTMDGIVYRMRDSDASWRPINTLALPRFFHRMVALDANTLLACGGAGRGGHMSSVERVRLNPGKGGPDVTWWSISNPGAARNRQGVVAYANQLWAVGGNRSTKQHDFAEANFLTEGFRISLGAPTTKRIAALPRARQSFQLVAAAGSPVAIGGFTAKGERTMSLVDVCRYDRRARSWQQNEVEMPTPRTQFGTCVWNHSVWVFGGLNYDSNRKDEPFRHLRDILVWDADTPFAKFEPAGVEMPRVRRAFGGAELAGRYYLVGGMRERFQSVPECDVLDLEKKTWTEIRAPRHTRLSPDLVAVRGRLFLGGGTAWIDGKRRSCESIEVYDPATDRWTVLLEKLPFSSAKMHLVPSGDRLVAYTAHGGSLQIAIIDPNLPRAEISSPATSIRHP